MNSSIIFLQNEQDVRIIPEMDKDGHLCAKLSLRGGEYEHVFNHRQAISVDMQDINPDLIARQYVGGHYVFTESGELAEFRMPGYKGFIHSEMAVDELYDQLGLPRRDRRALGESRVSISNKQDVKNPFGIVQLRDLPGLGDGGNHDVRLAYSWSMFSSKVQSVVEMVRLVCTNGAVARSAFLRQDVPIVNRWQQHLGIATDMMRGNVEGELKKRITETAHHRAPVKLVNLLNSHARTRRKFEDNTDELSRRLDNIIEATDTRHLLQSYYRESVLEDPNLTSGLPSHLTLFDAYNIATEMNSHTEAGDNSSTLALNNIATTIITSAEMYTRQMIVNQSNDIPRTFSSPEMAFFG